MRLRENSITLDWTVEIDDEREREREKGLRKENKLNLLGKKKLAEGDEQSGEREKRGEGKINK